MALCCDRFRIDDPRMAHARAIRETVFCAEQGVSADEEWDGKDAESDHFLLAEGTTPIGVARTRAYGPGAAKIERVAVLKEHRGKGAGRVVMDAVLAHLLASGVQTAILNAQVAVEGFYKDLGFVSEGEHFFEADIEHVRMTKRLR
jgi:predicted GNAT family N-acyltransferase